jgi:16S rRNA (guanine966-N2)-methyltransferase
VRVVAGRLRGRGLKAPAGTSTRPTGARVKEALFSILGSVESERVLDLYAGSGALGIEALSRGASFAVFIEAARPALACLRDNLATLALSESSRVIAARAETTSHQLVSHGPFDLVLCDPPWKDVAAARAVLETLAGAGLFSGHARLVLEHAAKDPPAPPDEQSLLVVADTRRWGDTAITLFGLKPRPADVPDEIFP